MIILNIALAILIATPAIAVIGIIIAVIISEFKDR